MSNQVTRFTRCAVAWACRIFDPHQPDNTNTLLAIVQARLSSARLPGKVLMPMAGRPMLGWLLDRLKAAQKISGVLVATSDNADDDAISEFCATAGVRCVRGSLNDVTGRMLGAANSVNADAFARINGDSPLLDPALVDAVVELFETAQPDIATNVHPRTFPKGFSVEVVRVEALERARAMLRQGEEEHVTQVFYRCCDKFRISNFTSGHDWGAINMSVDTPEDFALMERIIISANGAFDRFNVAELVALRASCAEVLL